MPGTKHHSDKWRRCVDEVMAKGHDQSSASAICTTSLQNAGESIYVAAQDHDEIKILAGSEVRDLHLLGSMGRPRFDTLNGRKHIVVPIVALMEGVIWPVNAATAEFVPLATIEKAASSWQGKPVTLLHPSKGGKQCSASDFEVRKASGIGVVINPRVEGKKLLCEAWIDEEKTKSLRPELYENLAAGGHEEVSVGAFVVTSAGEGIFGDKKFQATWLEASGDHLAILSPNGRGACSGAMGCGANRHAAHFVAAESIELVPDVQSGTLTFTSLEGASFDDRISAVNKAVNDKWPGGSVMPNAPDYGYVIQTFDDHVIVRKGDDYWDMPYSVKDGVVTLGEGKKVKQQWVSAAAYGKKECETCGGTGQVKDGTKQMDCPSCDGEGYMKAAAAIQPPPDDESDSKIHIRRTGSKWELVGSSGRVLARHDTEVEAKAQAEAVKAKVCA